LFSIVFNILAAILIEDPKAGVTGTPSMFFEVVLYTHHVEQKVCYSLAFDFMLPYFKTILETFNPVCEFSLGAM